MPEAAASAALAEQFDDPVQQYQAASLGMWAFLVTEVMFFGGMFTGYAYYRAAYSAVFGAASNHLDVLLGTVNTAVLLTSSLTMALAVWSAQMGRKRALTIFLILTMILGLCFLSIKFTEYAQKYAEGLIPGHGFLYDGPEPHKAQLFFSFYFAMTGTHAIHMVIGEALLAVLLIQTRWNHFSAAYYTPVDIVGLYWHFVDIIWIFLFPLLYLVSRHTAG